MKDNEFDDLPPELSGEYDEYSDMAVLMARGELSRQRTAELEAAMERDPVVKRLVTNMMDAYEAPPMPREIFRDRMGDVWNRIGQPKSEHELARLEARVYPRRWWTTRTVMRIAAGLLFAVTLGTTSYLVQQRMTWATRQTAADTESFIRFPDGSTVQLAPGARIRYRREFAATNTRTVQLLAGEARFSVRHIDRVGFEVTAGAAQIAVVGTVFVVHLQGPMTTVAVEEGTVRVSRVTDQSNSVQLVAGQRRAVTQNGILSDSMTTNIPTALRKVEAQQP